MSRAELNWFQLRFPYDLSQEAVLAALASLSGLPHGSKVVCDLRASESGITHQLGVSAGASDTVLSGLRAGIPSLGMQAIDELPSPTEVQRMFWQLSPAVAALRIDGLSAISAGLLTSLFPMAAEETVRLRWVLTSAPRPHLPDLPDNQLVGRLRVLRAKLALPGLAARGELKVTAGHPGRRAHLIQRLSSALRSLATPHGALAADPYWYGQSAYFLGRRGRYFSIAELAAVIGWPIDSPDVPGLRLGSSRRLVPATDLPEAGRVLGTSDFGGLSRPVAIAPAAGTRGLYVLGPTGTGKTSLLKNLILSDLEQGRGLVVIETNGDLITDLMDSLPASRRADVVVLDPTDTDFAVGFNPFASAADPSLIADQLGELFHRLWKAFWGPRTAQLTHMGLLTLARRQGSTLLDLPRLYVDPVFRSKVLAEVDDPVGLGPDWLWFEGLSQAEQSAVIGPLLNKVRQFTARPSIRAIVGQPKPMVTMRQIIEEQKVLLVHLPKGLIGTDTAQLLGCFVLTALWQAAAGRVSLPPAQRHPFGLYADEIQDFAAAPVPWAEMVAQGRKYGLSLTAAHQNLEQLPKELREVMLANARSKAVFVLSASDARAMERLFAPALTAADLQALDAYSIAALVALEDGSTARPVTLRTPEPPPSLASFNAVQESSRRRYARPRREVETALRAQVERRRDAPAPVGRKKRSAG